MVDYKKEFAKEPAYMEDEPDDLFAQLIAKESEDKNRGGREKSVRISTALKLTEKQILGSIKFWPTLMTIMSYLISE